MWGTGEWSVDKGGTEDLFWAFMIVFTSYWSWSSLSLPLSSPSHHVPSCHHPTALIFEGLRRYGGVPTGRMALWRCKLQWSRLGLIVGWLASVT